MESSPRPSRTTHDCPGPGCQVTGLAYDILACRRHWKQVSEATQARVWATWKGTGIGDYVDARAQAVSEMRP